MEQKIKEILPREKVEEIIYNAVGEKLEINTEGGESIILAETQRRFLVVMERFFTRVKKDKNGCWNWKGCKSNGNYGKAQLSFGPYNRKTLTAHRMAYWFLKGEIPRERQLDHLCKNTLCVNPKHLEIVTPRENMMRSDSLWGINARKTHCLRGHEFDIKNTRIEKDGGRSCRKCGALRIRAKRLSLLEQHKEK